MEVCGEMGVEAQKMLDSLCCRDGVVYRDGVCVQIHTEELYG